MSDTQQPQQLSAEELKDRFLEACALQEAGRTENALSIYAKLLRFIPKSALIHFNMGLAKFELNDFKAAAKHYEIASQENPEDPDIQYNLGLNLRRQNKQKEAIVAFTKATTLGDTSMETLYNIALCHQDLKEFKDAANLYERVLAQDKDHQSSLNNYAYLCHKTDDLVKAETLYKRLLQIDPHHSAAKHMLNALLGITPDNAPLDYIESVFDGYAENFEENLLKDLHYQTPTELWKLYRKQFPEKNNDTCLDLGCGTGLAGVAFQSACGELVGIDLSENILQVANEKNLYNTLVKDDILSYLTKTEECYDLLIAADVFTYIGNLLPLFTACYEKCKTDGILCFSVEEAEGDSFLLKETGRFGHPLSYIETLCNKTGWKFLVSQQSKLRQDRNKWISGHLFLFQK